MKRNDDVMSLLRKLQIFFYNMNTSNILILLLAVGIIVVLFNSISESIISAQSILIILISTTGMYIYFKKQFNSRLKALRLKNKILKTNSILDEVCNTKKNSKSSACTKYKIAKTNFQNISNILLLKFNLKE